MDAVALQHIKKSYTSYSSEIVLTGQTRQSRTRQVLRDLSVCFPIGQLTVIVGRSGCGKSTLLKLLAGKEQPDAGQIEMPQGWHSALLSPNPYVITWTNVQRNVAMACGVGKTPQERYEKAADFVRLVGLLGFERGQGDTAARDHRTAGRVQHIAAHRTHIQPGAAHIGRAVDVDDLLAGKQLGHGNAQRGCKRLEKRNVRKAAPGLPFGNCFVADADLLGELKLRQMLLFAQRADRRAGNIIVHIHAPFRVDFFL